MPAVHELPENRASWRAEPARAALLVHDMQEYFIAAYSRDAAPVPELLANVKRLRDAARRLAIPIFYSAQPGDQAPDSRGLLRDFWGPGLRSTPEHEAIAEELAASFGPNEVLLVKHRYSAFRRTELASELRRRGRDQLVICGVYAHLGCLLTACDAFMSDVQPFLVADAVADFTPELHRNALDYAAGRCGVALSTATLVESWEAATSSDSLLAEVRREVAELLLDGEAIEADESLFDRGLDSMRLMTLVERFRQRGADVTFGDLAERPTLGEWAKLLEGRTACA